MTGSLIELLEMAFRANNPDSIDIGTAGKGGNIKVYGNFSQPEEFKKKIDMAIDVRAHAQTKMLEGGEKHDQG
jgi:hypothetical protein